MKPAHRKMAEATGCDACARYLDLRQRQLWYKLCRKRRMSECEMIRRYAILAKQQTSAQPTAQHPASAKRAKKQVVASSATSTGSDDASACSIVDDKVLAGLCQKWREKRVKEGYCDGAERDSQMKRVLDESSGGSNDEDEGRRRKCARVPRENDKWKGNDEAKLGNIDIPHDSCKMVQSTCSSGDILLPSSAKNLESLMLGGVSGDADDQELNKRGDLFVEGALNPELPLDINVNMGEIVQEESVNELEGDVIKGMSHLHPNERAPEIGGETIDLALDDVSSSEPKNALNGNITQACGFFENIDDDMDFDGCKKSEPTKKGDSLAKGDKRTQGVKETEKRKSLLKQEETKKTINVSVERKEICKDKLTDGDTSSTSSGSSSREEVDEVKTEKETKKKTHPSKEECKTTEATSVERKRSDAQGEEVAKKAVKTRNGSSTSECEQGGDSESEYDDMSEGSTSSQSDEDSSSNVRNNPNALTKKKSATQKKCGFIEDFPGKGDDKSGKEGGDGCGEGNGAKPKVKGAGARKAKVETQRQARETRLEREKREERERKLRAREKIRNRKCTPGPAPCLKGVVDEREIKGFLWFKRKVQQILATKTKKYSQQEIEQLAMQGWRSLSQHEKQAYAQAAVRRETKVATQTKKALQCKNQGGRKK